MRVRQSTMVMLYTLGLIGIPLLAGAQAAPSQGDQRAGPLQTAPGPPVPVPLGVDGQVTSWLQLRGEFRARMEGFTGGGFVNNNDDAYWMDRFRLNATARASKRLSFFVQVHDARAFDKTTGGLAVPLRDTLDLRQAYGELASTHVTVRLGRQDFAFGEQRLIGNLPWANTARSFDAARVTLKGKRGQVDLFTASLVTIQPDAFDKSGYGNLLTGAYASLPTLIPAQAIEPYFFWRQSRGIAAERGGTAYLRQATTGARMAGKGPSGFDYSSELAVQTGTVGPDTIRAWAGHALVGKRVPGASGKPRLFAEYNYASGDANRADGTRGTFDQLYPTGHDKLGLGDQVGWRNIRHARTGIELKPASKWQLTGSYHSWWLASPTDGLYSASGALVARSLAGTAGRHVGQEVDAQLAYAYSPQLQIAGGYAYLIPGEFLKNTTPGHAYSYPYVMVTHVFMGDRPKAPAAGGAR